MNARTLIPALVIAVASSAMPGALFSQATGRHKPSVAVVLSIKQPNLKLGSAVEVEKATTNLTNHTIGVWPYVMFPDGKVKESFSIKLVVKDSQGRPVPDKKPRSWGSGSFWYDPALKPKETRRDVSYLSHSYDFSQPGFYTIQEIVWNDRTSETTQSNILTINIQ